MLQNFQQLARRSPTDCDSQMLVKKKSSLKQGCICIKLSMLQAIYQGSADQCIFGNVCSESQGKQVHDTPLEQNLRCYLHLVY